MSMAQDYQQAYAARTLREYLRANEVTDSNDGRGCESNGD